jgi:hypothetical protein
MFIVYILLREASRPTVSGLSTLGIILLRIRVLRYSPSIATIWEAVAPQFMWSHIPVRSQSAVDNIIRLHRQFIDKNAGAEGNVPVR